MSGFKTRAACKRPAETTDWGDAATTPTNQLPFVSETFNDSPTHEIQTALVNSASEQNAELVTVDDAGTMSFEAWFEGLEYVLFAALGFMCPTVYTGNYGSGSGGSPAPTGDGAHVHLFELDDELHRVPWAAGDRATSSGSPTDPTYWLATDQKVRCVDLCVDKLLPAGLVHRHVNAMVNKLTWKVTPQKVTMDVDFISRNNDTTGDGNESNWTLPASVDRSLFTGTTLYMATAGPTLTTEWGIQEMEFSLENNLSQDRETGTDPTHIIEPRRTAPRKVSGRIKLARFESMQWQTWMDGDSNVDAYLEHVGPTISGSAHPYSIRWMFPRMRITKAHFPVAGPGIMTGDIEFECMAPGSLGGFSWLQTLFGGITDTRESELFCLLVNTVDACVARDRQAGGVSLP